jgi:hypothetical protein
LRTVAIPRTKDNINEAKISIAPQLGSKSKAETTSGPMEEDGGRGMKN